MPIAGRCAIDDEVAAGVGVLKAPKAGMGAAWFKANNVDIKIAMPSQDHSLAAMFFLPRCYRPCKQCAEGLCRVNIEYRQQP